MLNVLEPLMFFLFAAVAIFAALGLVFTKNAVYSALFLLLNFCMIACLYILMSAQFLAFVQIMVYAGAIVVLILFVVMLLGAELGEFISTWLTPKTAIVSLLAFTLLAITGSAIAEAYRPVVHGTAVGHTEEVAEGHTASPAEETEMTDEEAEVVAERLRNWGSVKTVGRSLLTDYVLAFEFAGILLTVGIIGVVILGEWQRTKPKEGAK